MTTLEKIRAEIEKLRPNLRPEQMTDYDYAMADVFNDIVQIIDKYAEQEPCDDAVSREAVVDDFIEWREKLEYAVGEDYSGVHLLNVAIQKIWDMPSVTQKPIECDDVVSRQAVKDLFCRICMENNICYRSKDTCEDLKLFNQLPSVRPQEPKTGHWINVNEGKWNTIPAYKCSACGANADLRDWSGESPFCPWCGAKMVEPQESEE